LIYENGGGGGGGGVGFSPHYGLKGSILDIGPPFTP
jgi:hypothetical protein